MRIPLFAATLLAAAFLSFPVQAASGYDLTDVWWSPSESGWGLELVQSADAVSATLYVYDAAQRPVWYWGLLRFEGLTPRTHEANYAGELWQSTGPWFGAASFVPEYVAKRRVGSIRLRSPDLLRATLDYDVDGVAVSKAIERFTLRVDDYAGDYTATLGIVTSRCTNPADDGTWVRHGALRVEQAPGAMTLVVVEAARSCTYAGPYTQTGRLGSVASSYRCTTGEVGALVFNEMVVQRYGILARVWGSDSRGCHIEGSFAAARL